MLSCLGKICILPFNIFFSDNNGELCWASDGVQVLAQCLEAIRAWIGRIQLQLNPSKTEWSCSFGVTEWRKLTSLGRQNNTLPFIFGAQFGGSLLDSLPCWKGRSYGPGDLCINPSSMAIVSIPEQGDLAHNHSCFSHLPFELVQYTLHRAAV